MAAPTPRPAALRLVSGRSPGRDSGGRVVKEPPGFVRLPPEPPSWLSDEAKAEWGRVAPELQRLRLTKPADRAALTAYCQAWAVFKDATRAYEAALESDLTPLERLRVVTSLGAASKELRSWTHEFGLTPAAESRVGGSEDGDGGKDDTFA